MFILRKIFSPLQQEFKCRCKGDERGVWFSYMFLASSKLPWTRLLFYLPNILIGNACAIRRVDDYFITPKWRMLGES